MKRANIVAGILGVALSAYVFYATASFPEDQVVRVGPAFFPRLLAAGLGIFSIIIIVAALIGNHEESHSKISLKDKGIQRAIIAFIATVAYCLLFEYLGFITCSILYLLSLMLLLKERKYITMILTSVAVTLVVFFIFSTLLNITLPMGEIYGF